MRFVCVLQFSSDVYVFVRFLESRLHLVRRLYKICARKESVDLFPVSMPHKKKYCSQNVAPCTCLLTALACRLIDSVHRKIERKKNFGRKLCKLWLPHSVLLSSNSMLWASPEQLVDCHKNWKKLRNSFCLGAVYGLLAVCYVRIAREYGRFPEKVEKISKFFLSRSSLWSSNAIIYGNRAQVVACRDRFSKKTVENFLVLGQSTFLLSLNAIEIMHENCSISEKLKKFRNSFVSVQSTRPLILCVEENRTRLVACRDYSGKMSKFFGFLPVYGWQIAPMYCCCCCCCACWPIVDKNVGRNRRNIFFLGRSMCCCCCCLTVGLFAALSSNVRSTRKFLAKKSTKFVLFALFCGQIAEICVRLPVSRSKMSKFIEFGRLAASFDTPTVCCCCACARQSAVAGPPFDLLLWFFGLGAN